MDKKGPIKVRLSTVILSFIIFILIIAIFFMYYFNNVKNNESNNQIPSKNTQSNVIKESERVDESTEKIDLSIENEEVKKIYNYVTKFSYYDELIVYQTQKVTEQNIKNSLKLLTIFNNLSKEDATKITFEKDETAENGKREHVIYSKEVIEKKAKEIFGENVTIIHENASPYDSHSIIYKDGEYDSFDYEGGGAVPWESSKLMLVKAEKNNDGTIYIYDKYVHITDVDDIKEDGTNWAGSYDVYSASDKKVKLASKVNFEEEGIYKGTENLSGGSEEIDKIIIDNLDKYLGNKILTFKHTFKKNSDGFYYWYSTEPMK